MENPNQIPAHTLWVELTTRITTQPIHYRSGDEGTAANSVYNLFATTRELMEKHPDATQFNELSLKLLNTTLRPYTARWHRWQTTSKPVPGMPGKSMPVFQDEQVLRMFRAELVQLQQQLSHFVDAYKALADGRPVPEQTKKTKESTAPSTKKAALGADIAAGLPPYLDNINEKEHKEILDRRKTFNPEFQDGAVINATGLALSGGGIRSATFCLGIVQTLVKKNFFQQFDYLSTVSGGSYLGTFLSSVLTSENGSAQTKIAGQIIDEVFKTPAENRESKAVRHLRNNSKYLGTGEIPWMAGLISFGIFVNLLLLLPAPLLLALTVYQFEQWGFWNPPGNTAILLLELRSNRWGQLLDFILVMLVTCIFVLPFAQSATHGQYAGKWAYRRIALEKITLYLAIASLFFSMLYFLPIFFEFYAGLKNGLTPTWPMLISGALPFLLAYGAKLLEAWQRTQKIVLTLFVLSGPLFFLIVFFETLIRLGFGVATPSVNPSWLLFSTLLLSIWGWFLVNINTLSPHRYYRNRLCECFLLKRKKGNIKARTHLPLSELGNNTNNASPYHLINTTVNLTASKNPELRGRNGDFFLISKYFCGSRLTGYYPTEKVVEKNPHIDLGSAMAISGAAASTGMGCQTMANFRFLMGLMNIRLGYWLRNPKKGICCKLLEGPGPWYLYKEIFGWMKENDRYLNLSGGGHIENLAVYELLRRRCKFIVCVDGGHEPGMECAGLIRLQRYAEIDLGIRMEYDISDLQPNEYRFSGAYALLVKIIYPKPNHNNKGETDGGNAELGWMLYLKLAITGAEPAYVTDYRRTHPTFPHQTTTNQHFDEAQFEAYRMLGECAAESMFRHEIIGHSKPKMLQDWFQALANNLLPDNDSVYK